MKAVRWTTLIGLVVLTVAGLLLAHTLLRAKHRALPAVANAGEPQVMLWAWETPEDLTALDPTQTGVAYLSREVMLTPEVTVRPRMQPLHVAPGTWMMADVRLEAHLRPGTHLEDTAAARAAVVRAILPAAEQPNVRALQIDFDATASQLGWYAHLLADLRRAMPQGMPLSITALESWCGAGGWAGRLNTPLAHPVDEAVAMEFRLGGPRARRLEPKSVERVTAPVCSTAVGVATDETWPPIAPGQRVYVFRAGPWSAEEIAAVNRGEWMQLRRH